MAQAVLVSETGGSGFIMPWKMVSVQMAVATVAFTVYGASLPADGALSARFAWSSGLLSVAAFVYLFAFGAYLVNLARESEVFAKLGSLAAQGALALHTSGILVRWTLSGLSQPPWTNLYESLVYFAWGIATVYTIFEWRSENRSAGAFIIPVVVLMMGIAALSPAHSKGIPQLMPALKSGWIKIHVTFACIAYASFFTAFGFAMLFLIKDRVSTGLIAAVYSVFAAVTFLGYGMGDVIRYGEFPLKWPTVIGTGEVLSAPKPVPFCGQVFLVAFLFYAATAGLHFAGTGEKLKRLRTYVRPAFWLAFLVHSAGAAYVVHYAMTTHPIPRQPETSLIQWDVNAYVVGLVILVWTGSLLVTLVDWRGEKLVEKLPSTRLLDEWSYRAIIVGLPLLTLNLVTGAIWANNAWGSYWSWDPKETWALITWLVYAGYIHLRLAGGMHGRKSAAIAVAGFCVVMFTYLGVNLFLSGLHSYGKPQ